MIGWLSGRIIEKSGDQILLDVRGVGYIIHVSDRVMASLPGVGEAVALYTDLLVREDLMQLFGFTSRTEKEWHKLLMGVQGVGAKAALAIMGALGGDGLSRALALGDWSSIAKAKGIGPKTAQRVVMELKGKAPTVMAMSGGAESLDAVIEDDGPAPKPAARRARPVSNAQPDALSALGNLGYSPSDAAAAVAQAAGEAPDADASALILAALKLLAPKA
ncbi:Holliday junction branch migration protein RuvA [Ketogulonicigenium vulgare]|uniref:Holliday junction branch migration complex subunit RuvA n=1 Tax=Ketogulonicigenium vulgare (strain WSH-001) TaxID=759362 RepID=F9YAL1_KETVW|nr:Holliday junction branch migration protein RuvA [Ketogulonicigenium vulgare]ADO43248.1 Holliday junction DNA helicase motor protein [Ketogulonicigenium vulgare Y25]AEM41542.1 Holliday junction DNA helicase motor protein [Ketogulonicigenium vulgare WSH-001]ALJ81663.1 ATP-dependent DNA helicase RuvA [Ketogulonicigenium vulgare]ANW34333.1 Holliday junction DNA helicase RuvA [Ketogulonicigenium vulgare]AOZ55284.1 Holliday junction DNA helicase motor protein [Ketogulonicigenium vulgare]